MVNKNAHICDNCYFNHFFLFYSYPGFIVNICYHFRDVGILITTNKRSDRENGWQWKVATDPLAAVV